MSSLHARLISRKDLAALARRARGTRTQSEVAEELGVSQAAVSQAESDVEESVDKLRIRMIETYLGFRVRGPVAYFELEGGEEAT